MASTNKTTHYNLSQYIGSDKPTYLVDYNQDMSKIDTGIYEADAKAVVNATNIGDLTDLTTTDKLSLVNAINEVNSESSSVGDLQDLTTTDKTSVVGAVNEVNGKANTIGNVVNLTTTDKTSVVNAVNEVNAKAVNNTSNIATNTNDIATINGNMGNLSNLITDDKTSLVNAINEIDNKEIGITGHILWTNPNPTNSFSPQNITLSSGDYDELTIFYKKTNNENKLDSIQIIKGYGTDLEHIDSGTLFSRNVVYLSDTSYQFYDGKILLPGSSSPTNDNTRCVPIYIIGYKTGLFN